MRKLKGFTLVEILIVIVIIGILIGALVPRMQGAQGRARDVARKNDLSQLQAAIVASQQDKGEWPGLNNGATGGISIGGTNDNGVSDLLQRAGLSSIPADPLSTTQVSGLGANTYDKGKYAYMLATRNGTANGGFVLMAKTENEGSSNWVVCDSATNLSGGLITNGNDIGKEITLCTKVDHDDSNCVSNTAECKYKNESELRYILTY